MLVTTKVPCEPERTGDVGYVVGNHRAGGLHVEIGVVPAPISVEVPRARLLGQAPVPAADGRVLAVLVGRAEEEVREVGPAALRPDAVAGGPHHVELVRVAQCHGRRTDEVAVTRLVEVE